ncbi:hypothetical protein HPB47_005373 [Ixodes persulcatus]|uniref:Uncharacterized protein n=1 Tax=Ixodes persulcatus TaxID=34615 RepID=A0AC60PE01_IXOPE|nr:hypothetical protein HPB47_005373 [Ixodes persulcatus]
MYGTETSEENPELLFSKYFAFHSRVDLRNTIHGQLNETDAAIEPLLTDGEAEQEYARTIEYNDRVVAYSARLSFKITIASADGAKTSDRTRRSGNESSGSSAKVKLPKLKLLRFNGDSLQWQPFWEQFEQVVHNNRELSPTDKFNYLRAALSEEAAEAIAGPPATASCYDDARDILKARFGAKKRLIDDHMIRLLERPPIRSSLDIRGLRRLHDDLQGNIRGLRSLGVSEETFSTLLHPLILRLLPEDLVLAYHRTAVRDEEHRRLSNQSAVLSSKNSDQDRGQQGQLPILLRFLRVEIESRERTSCTKKTDHRLKDSSEEKRFISATSKETARSWTNRGTAAALLQRTENQACAFCKSSEKPETLRKSKVSTSPVTPQAAVTDEAKTTVLLQTATVWSSEARSATAQEKAALTEAHDDVGWLNKALSTSKNKTKVKLKMLLEQNSDLKKEVSVLQSQLEEKCQLLDSVQHAFDSKCCQMEETTRELAARKSAVQAHIAGLIQQLQDKEEDLSTLREQLSTGVQKANSEITSLQQSLMSSAETSSRLQTELMDLRSSLETKKAEKDSVDKTLKEVEDELKKAQDERKQLELSLSTVTADLEGSKDGIAKLKDARTFMKVQLRVAEAEKTELSERLINSLQCTEDVKQKKEALEARSDTLSKTVKELECKLCEAQHTGQQKEKQMIEKLSRLLAEKAFYGSQSCAFHSTCRVPPSPLFAQIRSREEPDQVSCSKVDIAHAPAYVPRLLSAPRASNVRRCYSPNSVTEQARDQSIGAATTTAS